MLPETTERSTNPLVKYWLIGMATLFPKVQIEPVDLPSFQHSSDRDQYLLRRPLMQVAEHKNAFAWNGEIEEVFALSKTQLVSRVQNRILDRWARSRVDDLAADSDDELSYRSQLDVGEDSVLVVLRPMATEIEILAGYLIALASVGVLVSLQSGAIDVDEAQGLIFLPFTSSLVGKLPYGSHLVCANHALLSNLFSSPAGPLEQGYLKEQVDAYLHDVDMFVDNVEPFELDPRWSLSARTARVILRLSSQSS